MSNDYARTRKLSSLPAEDVTRGAVDEAHSLAEVPISAKSLSKREQERVRAALRELQTRYSTQTELARALPIRVGQQTVSKALRDGAIGIKLARAVAEARHQTFEELVRGVPAARTFAELPGWADEAREAVRHGESVAAIEAVSRWPAMLAVARVEWRMIADLAGLWRRWAPPDEREEEETADAQREAEALLPRAGEDNPDVARRGQTKS